MTCLFYISQCCPWNCLFYISLGRPWRCLFYCIAAYVAPECVCSMCSLDIVSQPSVLPMDVCSTTAYDIPDVSVLHRPLLSLDVCGQQKFVLSLSLNFACSVNISCAAIKMYLFIYFYILFITFVKSFPGQGKGNILENSWLGTGTPTEKFRAREGEYLGKFRAGYRYINRFPKTLEEFRAGEGGISWKSPG